MFFTAHTLTKLQLGRLGRCIGLTKLARLSFGRKDKLRIARPASLLIIAAPAHHEALGTRVKDGSRNGSNPIRGGQTVMDTPGIWRSFDNFIRGHEIHGKVRRSTRRSRRSWSSPEDNSSRNNMGHCLVFLSHNDFQMIMAMSKPKSKSKNELDLFVSRNAKAGQSSLNCLFL